MTNIIKIGDLFSGIGCVAVAMKQLQLPFEYLFACDIDPHCKKNLIHNHNPVTFHDDVTKITELPKVDIFTAGFPCQPFSITNRSAKKGQAHKSHDLFTDTVRCLKLCDPEMFILENVKGLKLKSNAEYFKYICDTLDTLGYNWKVQLLNSKDHGIPQSRPRLYFVGVKQGMPKFPEQIPLLYKFSDFLQDLPLVPHVTNSKNENWTNLEHGILYIDNGQTSGAFQHFRKLPADYTYCLTIEKPGIFRLDENGLHRRKITTYECMKLQYLADEHDKIWYDNICSEPQFSKQIGNGMDCHMMGMLIKLNHSWPSQAGSLEQK